MQNIVRVCALAALIFLLGQGAEPAFGLGKSLGLAVITVVIGCTMEGVAKSIRHLIAWLDCAGIEFTIDGTTYRVRDRLRPRDLNVIEHGLRGSRMEALVSVPEGGFVRYQGELRWRDLRVRRRRVEFLIRSAWPPPGVTDEKVFTFSTCCGAGSHRRAGATRTDWL